MRFRSRRDVSMRMFKRAAWCAFATGIATIGAAIDVDWNIQTLLTNTLVPLQVTVDLGSDGLHLLEVRFEANGEELDTKTWENPGFKGPFVPNVTLNVDVDSTHWADGSNVTFKITVTYLDPFLQEQVFGPVTTIRPVYNKLLSVHDTNADDFGYSVLSRAQYLSFRYGLSSTLESASWTRDDFLNLIEAPTAIITYTHGAAYGSGDPYLLAPGGGGHISPIKVAENLVATTPPDLQFAFLLGCKSANNSVLLAAFLSEPVFPTNRCAIGFKAVVDNTTARDIGVKFNTYMADVFSAHVALQKAHEDVFDNPDYSSNMSIIGDLAKRVKWLYDGQTDTNQKDVWKRINS